MPILWQEKGSSSLWPFKTLAVLEPNWSHVWVFTCSYLTGPVNGSDDLILQDCCVLITAIIGRGNQLHSPSWPSSPSAIFEVEVLVGSSFVLQSFSPQLSSRDYCVKKGKITNFRSLLSPNLVAQWRGRWEGTDLGSRTSAVCFYFCAELFGWSAKSIRAPVPLLKLASRCVGTECQKV